MGGGQAGPRPRVGSAAAGTSVAAASARAWGRGESVMDGCLETRFAIGDMLGRREPKNRGRIGFGIEVEIEVERGLLLPRIGAGSGAGAESGTESRKNIVVSSKLLLLAKNTQCPLQFRLGDVSLASSSFVHNDDACVQ